MSRESRRHDATEEHSEAQSSTAACGFARHRSTGVAVSHADRLRPWLLGGMTALCVARPLFPSESAAIDGDGLTMVMLWIALAVFWLLGAVGRPERLCGPLRLDRRRRAAAGRLAHGGRACGPSARQPAAGGQHALGMGRPGAVLLAGAAVHRHRPRGPGRGRRDDRLWRWRWPATASTSVPTRLPQTRAKYQADPDRALRDAGLWFPPGSPERKLFEDRLAERRADGHLRPDQLAGRVSGAVAGDAGGNGGVGSGRNRKRLWGMLVCLIPIAVCLLLTKSRSGYIAAGVGLVLVWLLVPGANGSHRLEDGRRPLWRSWPSLAAAPSRSAGCDRELLARASRSFGYRLQYWQSSLQ